MEQIVIASLERLRRQDVAEGRISSNGQFVPPRRLS
jgi:hypothetical protein